MRVFIFVCVMQPKTSGQIIMSNGQHAKNPQISCEIKIREHVNDIFSDKLYSIKQGNRKMSLVLCFKAS